MAQLRIQIADPKPAIREGAPLPVAGGRVTQGVGQAAGPPDIQRQDPGVAAAPWVAVRGAAKEVIDLAGAWQDAADKSLRDQRTSEAMAGLREIEGRVSAIGEVQPAMTAWNTETAALRDRLSQGMSSNSAAAFVRSFNELSETRAFNVQRDAIQRQTRLGDERLTTVLNDYATAASAARNPADRLASLNQAGAAVEEAIARGMVRPERGEQMRRLFLQRVDQADALRMLTVDPAAAARALADPQQLQHLPPVMRYQLLDRATRRSRVDAGGLFTGPGAEPGAVQGLAPEQVSSLEAESAAWASQQDETVFRQIAAAERHGAQVARQQVRQAVDGYFAWATGGGGNDQEAPPDLRMIGDLLPASVREAVDVVELTGGAGRDDPGAMDALLTQIGGDPDEIAGQAARDVAAGRLTPGSFLTLTRAAREAAADTPEARAWRVTRDEMAATLTPPDLSDALPALPDLSESRRDALAEIDGWRAANAKASAKELRAEAQAIAQRHRERVASRLMETLPRPESLAGVAGPYVPEALDDAEVEILDALDAGALSPAQAAQRLRIIEGWRWVGEDVAPDGRGRDR